MGWINDMLFAAGIALQLATVSNAALVRRDNAVSANYLHDGRTCCLNGDQHALILKDGCAYYKPGSVIPVVVATKPPGFLSYVSQCCWDDSAQGFNVHYWSWSDKMIEGPLDITGGAEYPNSFCTLRIKWNITKYRLTADSIALLIDLNVDCWPYNKSDEEWIIVHFDHKDTSGGKFTYVITGWGPTIYADITTRINGDNASIHLHGHVTATGVASPLDETIDADFSNDDLKRLLSTREICN
ncbi:hypothetical protein PT974_07574 [Cladobotryum mycophilum]|uniref:Uncharacterized protein n=1 Tax=Cladobotryum mycophilum TaxID=491253 RepID=A0ABR0SPM8_9HYPO